MGPRHKTPSAVGPDVIDGLRKRENWAYRRIVSELGPNLMAVARRFLRNEADAKDILQESFVLAFRKIETFSGDGSLEGWLRRIVINAALGRLRQIKAKNEANIDDLMPNFDERGCRIEPHLPDLPSPEAALSHQQTRHVVREAIDTLPDTYRTILLLRDIEGFSTQEAADSLGIEPGAAKVRLHRARSALKKLLEPLREAGRLQ